jgi:hypothetical protein
MTGKQFFFIADPDDLPIEVLRVLTNNLSITPNLLNSSCQFKNKKKFPQNQICSYKETLVDFKENFWVLGSFELELLLTCNLKRCLILMCLSYRFLWRLLCLNLRRDSKPSSTTPKLSWGHVISAIVGVTVATFVPDIMWLTASLSVSISIVLMQLTKHYILREELLLDRCNRLRK